MTGEEIRRVLEQVTEEVLAGMRRNGFKVDPDDEDEPLRFDPIPWDINNGYCDTWADIAVARLPEGAFATWVDKYHCVLVYDGRFYDADCPGGTRNLSDLPMIATWDDPRPEP